MLCASRCPIMMQDDSPGPGVRVAPAEADSSVASALIQIAKMPRKLRV